jgi:hypothetical protein
MDGISSSKCFVQAKPTSSGIEASKEMSEMEEFRIFSFSIVEQEASGERSER